MPARGEDLNHLGTTEPLLAQGFREFREAPDGNTPVHRAPRSARINDKHHLPAKFIFGRLFDKNRLQTLTHTNSPTERLSHEVVTDSAITEGRARNMDASLTNVRLIALTDRKNTSFPRGVSGSAPEGRPASFSRTP